MRWQGLVWATKRGIISIHLSKYSSTDWREIWIQSSIPRHICETFNPCLPYVGMSINNSKQNTMRESTSRQGQSQSQPKQNHYTLCFDRTVIEQSNYAIAASLQPYHIEWATISVEETHKQLPISELHPIPKIIRKSPTEFIRNPQQETQNTHDSNHIHHLEDLDLTPTHS